MTYKPTDFDPSIDAAYMATTATTELVQIVAITAVNAILAGAAKEANVSIPPHFSDPEVLRVHNLAAAELNRRIPPLGKESPKAVP